MTTQDITLIDQLNGLIALHRAALDACEHTSLRVTDLRQRANLRELVRDHLRRIDELSLCVSRLGGDPTHRVARAALSTKAAVGQSEDSHVLDAVLQLERELSEAYQRLAGLGASEGPLATAIATGTTRQRSHQKRLASWRQRTAQV